MNFTKQRVSLGFANIPRSAISTALGVSKTYAGDVRTGRLLPHPRHWKKLAELVGIFEDQQNSISHVPGRDTL
jgi:hypothetical protein